MALGNITPIDPGSPTYWRDRQRGFRLIHEAELAVQRAAKAPMFLSDGYDEDGDVIPIENLGPFEAIDDAFRMMEADPTAVSILVAQGRTHIGSHRVRTVIRRLGAG